MARRPRSPATAGGNTGKQPSNTHSPENGLREALDQSIGPLVPQSQRGEVVDRVYTVLVQEQFSGPMPHPRHLREYEDILPGSAERILSMAERALAHHATMDSAALNAAVDDRKRGMRFGLWAFIASLLTSILLAYLGLTEVAIAALGTTVIGAVAVFVQGRKRKE